MSNIERNTLRSIKGIGDNLSESHISKIEDTTNEDFKELLTVMEHEK